MTTGATTTGTVKWFNESKGFGFLVQDSGGPDVFVHSSKIRSKEPLLEGQKVMFDVEQGAKGLEAHNVHVL